MNRIIVDYKKLTSEILNLLVEKFPDGYGIRDIIRFTNPKGQYVEAVEVATEDTIYLVKISDELVDSMENFYEEEDDLIAGDLEIDLDLNLKVPIDGDENEDLENMDMNNDDLDFDDNGDDNYNDDIEDEDIDDDDK